MILKLNQKIIILAQSFECRVMMLRVFKIKDKTSVPYQNSFCKEKLDGNRNEIVVVV
jgi:hypothetical protein